MPSPNSWSRSSRLAAVIALASACGGSGGGGPDAAPPSDAPVDVPAGELVRVWHREHVVVGRPQLMTMAAALGLTGTIEEDDQQLRMVASTAGPAGPLTIALTGFGALSFDSYLDLDEAAGRLTGSVAAGGALTITGLQLPPARTTITGGGTITVQIGMAGNGSGAIDLATSKLTLSLPLTATATCAGGGCWAGSCTLTLGTLSLTSDGAPWGSSPYNFASGEAGLEGDLAEPQVASCTVAAPATVANQLGFGSGFTSWELAAAATPAFGPRQTSLVLDKHHGEISYSRPAVDEPPAAAALPDDAAAQTRVSQLLTMLGVALPDPVMTVGRRKNVAGAEVAVAVRVTPRLALRADGSEPTEVEDAGALFALGDGGAVESLQVRWTPVTAGALVAPIGIDQAWTELGGTGPRPAEPRLVLGYVGAGHGYQPTFLDPVWKLIEPQGSSVKVVAATDFTPRLGLETLIAGRSFALTGPMALTAVVERGTPPYTVTWTSSVNGAIGTGLTINAQLSVGAHVLTLEVRDAMGAGLSAQVPVEITASPFPAPAAGPGAAVEVKGAMNVFPERIGASYVLATRKDRVGPRVSIRNANGVRAGTVSPGPFRYTMVVRLAGQQYVLRSSRCDDVSGENDPACAFPSDDAFTQLSEHEPLRWSAGGRTATARARYDRMPGRLTLDFRYTVTNAYAGPPPAWYEKGGAWLLHGSLAGQLGGVAPALVPEIAWSYERPGKDDDNACVTLYAIWFQSQHLPPGDPEDVGSTTLTEAAFAGCDADPFFIPYTVESFEVDMLSLVQPADAPGHYSTLVDDGADHTADLDATDGALDRTHQPSPQGLFGDAFTEITPIERERHAVVARPGASGDWDNWHGKFAPSPYFVTFPGCNHAFAKERLIDWRPCLHIHERWFTNPTWSNGQDVLWHLVRDHAGERDPRRHPRHHVDGEAIAAQPQLLWHHSRALSNVCEGAGNVANWRKPCRVFRSPVFETH